MNFVEAHRVLKGFAGGSPLPFLLAMSGTSHQLDLFLRAAGARKGYAVDVSYLAFGTLAQHLHATPNQNGAGEVLLLTPWDFVPSFDWRLGFPAHPIALPAAQREADEIGAAVRARAAAIKLYLPAGIPPIFHDRKEQAILETHIRSMAAALDALVLPADAFAMGTYLATGCPIAGERLGEVADAIIAAIAARSRPPSKVLITDLDNVLWGGVIAEEGLEAIAYGAEGPGYRHFLYQGLLRQLRNEGVLLAAVSRNDPRDAMQPLRSGKMLLRDSDFVEVIAGYGAKSQEIAALASRLNLGLDSFVFVDDNAIELAEVAMSLPQLRCFEFPAKDDDLPRFLTALRSAFNKAVVTAEDRNRTELYRARAASAVPEGASGGDLTKFLQDLRMELTIYDRSHGPFERAVQLISKTTQFSLNGQPRSAADVRAIVDKGGALYTARLVDKAGDHGEILSLLISNEGVVESFVMSCRVFQRRIEHAFLAWLAEHRPPSAFRFRRTERNEPIRLFLADAAFSDTGGGVLDFQPRAFEARHRGELNLFELKSEMDRP